MQLSVKGKQLDVGAALRGHVEDLLPPAITKYFEIETEIESLSVSDAVMRMDLSNENALLFRNSASGAVNLVYMRSDGNIGWMDPRTVKEDGAP